MNKVLFLFFVCFNFLDLVFSQGVSVNTTGIPADKSAILDVSATDKGLLIPRMSIDERPINPAEALLIYNTTTQCFEAYNSKTAEWVSIGCLSNKSCGSTFTDSRDGIIYKTVLIDKQCWMKENLNSTKYINGEDIPNINDNLTWASLTTGAYCNYANDQNNAVTYGRLYNWFAVNDSRKLCPIGWHIPTDDEFTTLITFLGGDSIAGGKMKETGFIHWQNPNTGSTNESGFTALPSGARFDDDGTFFYIGNIISLWSSTENDSSNAWSRHIVSDFKSTGRGSDNKKFGFSVRCLKD